MKKRVISIIIIGILVTPTIIWTSSLIKCEVLTTRYFAEFETACTQNTMLGEMEYFKVLRCDGRTAEVYYVSKDMIGADVLVFENDSGIWVETSWRTIWSKMGSASDVIYPYWWHFIYFLF